MARVLEQQDLNRIAAVTITFLSNDEKSVKDFSYLPKALNVKKYEIGRWRVDMNIGTVNLDDVVCQIYSSWKQKEGSAATLDALFEALKSVGWTEIAQAIADLYGVQLPSSVHTSAQESAVITQTPGPSRAVQIVSRPEEPPATLNEQENHELTPAPGNSGNSSENRLSLALRWMRLDAIGVPALFVTGVVAVAGIWCLRHPISNAFSSSFRGGYRLMERTIPQAAITDLQPPKLEL